ncbi:hypothetical protein HY636_03810 [Candidatus Woesearchaeota archaeon]|nr:hypothetical protein [Candidatus Woesearchaeota archaeon]
MDESLILVVDTNILFTFFWKNFLTPEILIKKKLKLITSERAINEIDKHAALIIDKTGITKKEFKIIKDDLYLLCAVIPLKEYSLYIKRATDISPDEKDIDFLALSFMFKCTLWSNDRKLKEQDLVEVLNTKEIIELSG